MCRSPPWCGCLLPGSLLWWFDASAIPNPLAQLTSGGLLPGAFLSPRDLVTSPTSAKGKLWFGAGLGFLVFVIRAFGNFPEGVAFAVLIMNAATPLIDNFTRQTIYGSTVAEDKARPPSYSRFVSNRALWRCCWAVSPCWSAALWPSKAVA